MRGRVRPTRRKYVARLDDDACGKGALRERRAVDRRGPAKPKPANPVGLPVTTLGQVAISASGVRQPDVGIFAYDSGCDASSRTFR